MAAVKNGLMRLRSSRTSIAEMLMAFLLAQLTLAVSRGGQHFETMRKAKDKLSLGCSGITERDCTRR
jgi:hypothetical protein